MSLIKVSPQRLRYRDLKGSGEAYTLKMDKSYDQMAKFYNAFMAVFPLWKKWISSVMPHISGQKILEVSFGPGYLLEKCAVLYECYGLDFNETMVNLAKERLASKNLSASLIQGNVESMPYEDSSFDTVINTMAFTGYPHGGKAMDELFRVLKPGGSLLIVDFDYPEDRNLWGYGVARFIDKSGDILKDISGLLKSRNVDFERCSIGAFGSVQLYIITKS